MSYFCSKCNRSHKRGKIWEDHKIYQVKEDLYSDIDTDKINNFDPNKLRSVALRQIGQLFIKMGSNGNRSFYIGEINRLLSYETGRGD